MAYDHPGGDVARPTQQQGQPVRSNLSPSQIERAIAVRHRALPLPAAVTLGDLGPETIRDRLVNHSHTFGLSGGTSGPRKGPL